MIATNDVTCTQGEGGELDFAVVSRTLESAVTLKADWQVPWKPHAALRLTIANAGACNPQWKLQQFGKLAGDVSEAVWPEVTAAPPCIMGSEGQDNSSCSLSRWAKAMEVCRGNVQGRGQDVNKVWGALQETRCMKASTSTPAGWWGRMRRCVALLQSRVHTNQWETSKGDATQVDVFLLKHVVRPEQEAFKAKVCDAFAQRQVGQLQTLREWSEAQESEAQVAASRESHQNFKRWLQVGMAKSLRPLFSSLSKAESVFVRPFADKPIEERARLRRKQWAKLWGEAPMGFCPGDNLNQEAKHCQLPPIEGQQIRKISQTAADKAGGLDGLTFAAFRSLPSTAYEEFAVILNDIEARLEAPVHWKQHQVCMLPKKPEIERPITLTSITYRIWCFARRAQVQKWMQDTQAETAWDRATPGNTCLQVALQRLLKGEVSRHNSKHMIGVLIDLETFYDCVDLRLLAERLREADFPPVIGALALQAYAGERHIVSEDVLSEGVKPERGILAGCPMATAMARVFLSPVLRKVTECAGLVGLDTWVDDIGADFEDKKPKDVARQALEGYRLLAEGFQASGLKISQSKTGFLASTKEARRELQALLNPEDPKIFQSMRDLGVDCALGRVRRVAVQKARLAKGKKRQGKLTKLRVPVEACRLRLFKGSVCASMLWGHQAQGLPPSRLHSLRRAVAQHLGLQKLGYIGIALSAEDHRVADPWATVVVQQVQEWFTALSRWGPDQVPLERAWQQMAHKFQEGSVNWHHVKGPMAATVGHMTGIHWSMPSLLEWQRPQSGQTYDLKSAVDRALILQDLCDDIRSERCKRIAVKFDCPHIASGVDWHVGRKFLRFLRGKGDHVRVVALRAVWQGSLICEANSPVKECPLCKTPATWEHVLLHCRWWDQQGCELPPWFRQGQGDGPKGFWTRGLRSCSQMPLISSCRREGVWNTQGKIDATNLTFSTDASGGPFNQDPRLRRVGVSVICFEWRQGEPVEIGRIVSTLPGRQTVYRGELYGVLLLLQNTTGDVDATVDCLGVVRRLRHAFGKLHVDLWAQIRQEQPSRLQPTWVGSHLSRDEFIRKFGFKNEWRRTTNDVADKACSQFANSLLDPKYASSVQERDVTHRKILELLSTRAAKVLGAKNQEAHPCVKAYQNFKDARAQSLSQQVGEGKSGSVKKVAGRTRVPGSNIGHGHTQTCQEWFAQLVAEGSDSPHQWQWQGLDLTCEKCGLRLLHSKNRKVLQQREATPRGADGPGQFEDVHSSHNMQLQGQLWKCTQCGGQLSLHGKPSSKLQTACARRKDPRSKVDTAQALEHHAV